MVDTPIQTEPETFPTNRSVQSSLVFPKSTKKPQRLQTFTDLFCGVGGFHLAAVAHGLQCVFACDIDAPACEVYFSNFGIVPQGDITRIAAEDIPDHDLLCAGFPCQPFSIIGDRAGFADERGTLFFHIVRVLKAKQPTAFILENVKQLVTAQKGRVMEKILSTLRGLGYDVDYRVLNALDYGLPQKRERVFIVGRLDGLGSFRWPQGSEPMKPLSKVLEKSPAARHFASPYIRQKRKNAHTANVRPSIWHENKGGNISSHPFSCALRAGASYNYLLVDGERRLTPREMFRLQGFPDSFKLHTTDGQCRKQAGNSVPVPIVRSVLERLSNV